MPSTPSRLIAKVRRRLSVAQAQVRTERPEPGAGQDQSTAPASSMESGGIQASSDMVADEIGLAPLPITVAVAARPRLARLLAPEWQQMSLRPGTAVEDLGCDFVLLEVRGGRVSGWEHTHPELVDSIHRWMLSGVPVVVWVTSGPLTDAAWIKDVTSVAAVTNALADELRPLHHTVMVLPAAAQPRRHRPSGPYGRRHGAVVIVDGLQDLASNDVLAAVVSPALKPLSSDDLLIQRVKGKSSSVTLPTSLGDRVGRSIGHEDVAASASRSRVGLDLSACGPDAAWTSMALASSANTLVGTPGLSGNLPDDVAQLIVQVEEPQDLRSEMVARVVQEELFAREGHRLHRAVLNAHTLGHRARSFVHAAGVDLASTPAESVSAIVPTNRQHEISNILENVGRQSFANRELVLVLHGLEMVESDLRARASDAGIDNLAVVNADPGLTLGACMNLGVDAASGRYIAKMDDDNFYGEHYLADLVNAFSYSSAGIVGKWCHYVWLRSSGAVVLRYPDSEHRSERRIQGGSMLFDGDVARALRFSDIPRAVDSDILDRARLEGVGIYSADRFNFVSIRGADRHSHTWTVGDSTFMTKTGRLMFYGDPRQHASV